MLSGRLTGVRQTDGAGSHARDREVRLAHDSRGAETLRSAVRLTAVALILVLVSVGSPGAATTEPEPVVGASGTTDAGGGSDQTEWFKPGDRFVGQWADPTMTRLGPLFVTAATVTGGAHLPISWTQDHSYQVARTNHSNPSAYGSSDPYLNDGIVPKPPWPTTLSGHAWLKSEAWAPTIARIGTQWVSYHAVRMSTGSSRFCIFFATGPSAFGPFTARSQPLICQAVNEPSGQNSTTNPNGYIDPDVFIDYDGTAWLLFKSEGGPNCNYPKIWIQKLASNGEKLSGSAVQILTRRQPCGAPDDWEGKLVENPSMVRYKGRYLLLYSANEWNSTAYATGYAICSSPTGPCSRPSSSPLLRTGGAGGIYGPGGGDAYVDQRGRLLMIYQTWCCNGSKSKRVSKTASLNFNGATVSVSSYSQSFSSGKDYVWRYGTSGAYTSREVSIGSTYSTAVGDFNGDGRDQLLLFGMGGNADYLAKFDNAMGMTTTSFSMNRNAIPVAGDFDGDGDSDTFWYSPGPVARDYPEDVIWYSEGTNLSASAITFAQNAFAYPLVGDFLGDGVPDILWVTPGTAGEVLWDFNAGGTTPSVSNLGNRVTGDYFPLVGDFKKDGSDDILWYAAGTVQDYLWDFNGGTFTNYTNSKYTANGVYEPFVGDFDGNGFSDIIWYAPGATQDFKWSFIAGGGYKSAPVSINGAYTVLVGDYNGDGVDDVVWYS